ncbi:MAG: TetR/AcrR family transcriptional regulator [Firmicutes bacterium]|nr:TetR/AcrR family transcriptional regulator [Bacillota bacterium]
MPKETFLRLKDEKQETVLRAAIHEFVKHGFDRAKVSNIARKAGIAKGSIYQYFEDKKELFVYCAQWSLTMFMEKLDKRANITEMDVFEYFKDSIKKSETIDEEREIIIFMQYIAREPGLIAPSLKAMYDATELYGKKLIQNSKKKGIVRADIDDDILLDYYLAVTEKFKMRWMDRYLDFTIEITEEKNNAMKAEMTLMLELLKKGMGC